MSTRRRTSPLKTAFSQPCAFPDVQLLRAVGAAPPPPPLSPHFNELAEDYQQQSPPTDCSTPAMSSSPADSSASGTEESDDEDFYPGEEVWIVNLQKAAHLNGCKGTIVDYAEPWGKASRVEVCIQGHDNTKSLKVDNILRVLATQP